MDDELEHFIKTIKERDIINISIKLSEYFYGYNNVTMRGTFL